MTKEQRNAYMREYRQRPEVRERILAAQREYDFWNRTKNRARWNAHNKKRRRARHIWYSENRDRILAAHRIKRSYIAKFGAPPKGYVVTLELMAKSIRTGRDGCGELRKQLAESRSRAVATRKSRSREEAKRRAQEKIARGYVKAFGPLGFAYTSRNLTLMQKSLKTGKDALAVQRRRQDEAQRAWSQRRAKERARRNVDHGARSFTADAERRMTSLVKRRRLYEGACDLPWADYFAFREVKRCERLAANDVRYLSQWTACPV
jgi:hypothetical protein